MRREGVKSPKPFKAKTPEQALNSLMRQCARAERSSGDAMRLMSRWGVETARRAEVLEQLIKERFIDDERYAAAYVREKLNLSGWGARKIASSLKAKGVAETIITAALSDLDHSSMRERLCEKIERKARTVKFKDRYDLRNKLIRYGLSLGYQYDMIGDVVSQAIQFDDE